MVVHNQNNKQIAQTGDPMETIQNWKSVEIGRRQAPMKTGWCIYHFHDSPITAKIFSFVAL